METKHTPLPWELRLETQNYSDDPWQYLIELSDGGLRSVIARGYECDLCPEHGGSMQTNAEFILEACNNYERVKADRDELAAALRKLLDRDLIYFGVDHKLTGGLTKQAIVDARAVLAKLEARK